MNSKSIFALYIDSNSIREMVLNLCKLSRQTFEISLNSSLITDELSLRGEQFKNYTIYSEKINNVSIVLNSSCLSMIILTTNMMETSLESTKHTERLEKLKQALVHVSDKNNFDCIEKSANQLSRKVLPLLSKLSKTIDETLNELETFEQSMKKLWLLCNNLKAHVEKEGLVTLNNIISKIEFVLDHAGGNVLRLNTGLISLAQQIKELE